MSAVPLFRLFVYGTLKRGRVNYRRYCSDCVDVVEATIPGRLYQMPPGYPGLVIDEAQILAIGTASLAADVRKHETLATAAPALSPSAPLVHGGILTLPDPGAVVPLLDRLEGFQPGGPSVYRRVIAWATPSESAPLPVWVYAIPDAAGLPLLKSGRWPE